MAKFEVMITEHVQRSVRYEVSVSKKEVVEALGLEGEDAKDWKERVSEYLESEWETVRDRPSSHRGDEDEGGGAEQIDIDDVTELETA